VLVTLPGTVVLYEGDEIAMTDVQVPAALRRDPMTPSGLSGEGPRPGSDPDDVGFLAFGWLHLRGRPPVAPLRDAERNVADQLDDRAPHCGSAGT